jgi:hypothetical protein
MCALWLLRRPSAMAALHRSGVKFREIVLKDGTVKRCRRPRLEPWEEPRQDPSELRPMHPRVLAERREARRRQRARGRALREAAATEDDGGASAPTCNATSSRDDRCKGRRADARARCEQDPEPTAGLVRWGDQVRKEPSSVSTPGRPLRPLCRSSQRIIFAG